MKKLRVLVLAVMTVLFMFASFVAVPVTARAASTYTTISCAAHCQGDGWKSTVTAKEGYTLTAGTTGQGKRLEALTIKVNSRYGGSIQYRTHLANIGWTSWVSNGATSGTTGQSRAIEAVEMKLTGTLASNYNIYYRVHVKNFGWLGWAKDGATAGSTGISLQAEAIQIKLVKKGTSVSTGGAACLNNGLTYIAHVANIGWMNWVSGGATAGTTGASRQMEGLKASLNSIPSSGISYSAHVANVGWQSAVTNGALAGTTGQSKAMEAVKINLTGLMASYFDIYYRVHSANYGWLGWAKNGEVAGTVGYSLRAEAIQIKLVPKGTSIDRGGAASYTKTTTPASSQTTPASTNTSTSSSVLSNAKVNAFINDARFRKGTTWSASQRPKMSGAGSGTGCNAYVRDYAKYVYGKTYNSGTKFTSASAIKAGDVVHVTGSGHWFVVLTRTGDSLDVIHGNWGGVVARSTFTISGNKIKCGSSYRTFDYGYHY